MIFDLPTYQQKRVLRPRLITWIISAYLTFQELHGQHRSPKKSLSSHCGKGRGHSFEES